MNINDIFINYTQYGKKKGIDMVLLHGWGQNVEMMKPLGNSFKNIFRITLIDLPGFGNSDEPKKVMDITDYAQLLNQLFEELNIKNPIIIGHSFGGSVGIVYASLYKVRKLVLLASPFERNIKKESLKTKLLKKLKYLPFLKRLEGWAKNNIGSVDYRKASPIMKEVLVKAVNSDLTENAKMIKCPTLLIWGENDTAVSVAKAEKLEKLIYNSGLVIFERCSHYAYLEDLKRTVSVLDKFLEVESKENEE